ncbi:MAG: hypothetical protein KDC38_10595, partial [Planctomycetes bacterium]|nr:hypothetical protein [Planctomycetota bacterium]
MVSGSGGNDDGVGRGAGWHAPILGLGALALVMVLVGPATADDSINLLLETGEHLQGRVVDLGGPTLEVGRRGGANHIAKSRVARWTYVPPEGDRELQPVLVLRNRHEISGDIEFQEDTREWLIRLDVGQAKYGADKVLRLIQPNGSCSDGGFTPRGNFADRARAAIEKVRSDEPLRQREGREFLTRAGFFALRYLEEALEEKGNGDPDPGGRLIDIATRERVRVALPEVVAERFPDLVETLFSGSTDDRLARIREAFFEVGSEIFPLYVVLLLDARQPPELRGYIIDLFQRTQRIEELARVYGSSTGKAQLAAAIALGDAGAYVGVGTLIEALGIDDLEVRKLALQKLVEYTGESFEFDPERPASEQTEAIEEWKKWWDENHRAAEESLVRL